MLVLPAMKHRSKHVSAYLTPDEYERLRAYAERVQRSLGQVVRLATLEHIAAEDRGAVVRGSGRICVECDRRWIAGPADSTERCPVDGCAGIGEPYGKG